MRVYQGDCGRQGMLVYQLLNSNVSLYVRSSYPRIAIPIGISALLEPIHRFYYVHAVSLVFAILFILLHKRAHQSKILFKADKLMLQGNEFKWHDFEGFEDQEYSSIVRGYLAYKYKMAFSLVDSRKLYLNQSEAKELKADEVLETEYHRNYLVEGHFWKNDDQLRWLCVIFNLPTFTTLIALSLAHECSIITQEVAVMGGIAAWVFGAFLSHLIFSLPQINKNQTHLERDLVNLESERLSAFVGDLQTQRALKAYHKRVLEIVKKAKKVKTN